MRHWSSIVLGAWSLWMCSGPAAAFNYEVLYEDTLARDAVTLGRSQGFSASFKSVLIDGKVETAGTEAVSYDRLLINSMRVLQQLVLSPNASVRLTLPVVGTFEKQEGKQIPRIISQATWVEAKPKLEFVFATQNSLDLVLGLNVHYLSKFDVKTKSENFQATEHYKAASMNYAHLAIVKRGGRFDGGFAFQFDAEKSRTVSKTTTLDDTSLSFDDRVHNPATITIFANAHQSFGDLYGEFAAVEASGGGNLTDSGIAVREDYFRTQFSGLFPLGGKALQLESTLLYKSLSYADNRNVTLDTIPMLGLHLKMHLNYGLPSFVGLIAVQGSDGQSLQEFNADYHIIGLGGVAGINLIF